MNIGDIVPYATGAAGSLFITTKEVDLAEGRSGVSFENAKPGAGAPFIEFSKWFFSVEIAKLTGLYFAQDYIDQPFMEKLLHGVMFGNVATDILYWMQPGIYRKVMNMFSGL